jgi:hypothetical protein
MSIIRVDAKFFEKLITLETKFEDEDLIHFISRKYVDLEDKAVRDALVKLGWTPPSKKENHGYIEIKVPAEWDGCDDGFEPIRTEYPNPPVQDGKEPAQESSESDQDQICADLAERNRELESKCQRLQNELNVINHELKGKYVELDKLHSENSSLKADLQKFNKLRYKYRVLEGHEIVHPGDEFYNFDIQTFVSLPVRPPHSYELFLKGDKKVSDLEFQGRKAIIRRKIRI